MAINESTNIPAQPNVYNGYNERDLRIDFSIPESGTDEGTGIFIFVPGFGGNIDSNIYKKMPANFAYKFNIITVQCEYFGSRFMRDIESFRYDVKHLKEYLSHEEIVNLQENRLDFLSVVSQYNMRIPGFVTLDETPDEFVDMGYMQAIDVITAIEAVRIILRENQLPFNEKRVIGYGHSHGAYLLHLVNKLHLIYFRKLLTMQAG